MTYLFHLFVNIYPRQYVLSSLLQLSSLHPDKQTFWNVRLHLYNGMRDNSDDASTAEISLLTVCIKTKAASAGNRTRAARVAGEHSTTEPPMLICILGITCTYKDPRLTPSVFSNVYLQFLWIVYFWLPLRYSLTFIYSFSGLSIIDCPIGIL